MAIEKVINVNVQGNADQAIGSLRTQLRAAQLEVAVLSDKFGTTSKEATEAAKRAADLKDRIGDARALTDAFNPDAKFKALSASLAGVAGGFAAVQGGMGLLGVQSESVEKTLLKVQSAMALSQGLQSLGESVDSFKQLGAVVQSTTAFRKLDALATTSATAAQRLFSSAVNTTAVSFNTLKAAIVTTGIGALVVGLGYLISKMSDSADAAQELTDKQKELNTQLEYTKQLTDAAAKSIEYNTQIELANAKKRGASDEELTRIKIKGVNERLKANTDEINRIKATQDNEVNLTKEQNKRIQDLRNENLDLTRKARVDIANFEADAAEKQRQKEEELRKSASEKEKERRKKELEALKKHHEDLLAEADRFFKAASDAEIKAKEDLQKQIENLNSNLPEDPYAAEQRKQKELIDATYMTNQQRIDALIAFNEAVLSNEQLTEDEKTQLFKANSEARAEIAKKESEARIQAADATANTLNNLSDLIGKQTGAGKALAIAAATISMITSAQQAYQRGIEIPYVGMALAPINAGIAIAAGLKNIQAIMKVKTPGSSGGGSAPSIGSAGGGTTAPQFNVVGNSGVNQLANVVANKEQPPVKTYVVASDVTSAQSLDRNIVKSASLG